MNTEIKNKMDWSNKYTFRGKRITIHYETDTYIICSFVGENKRFKVDKTVFNETNT